MVYRYDVGQFRTTNPGTRFPQGVGVGSSRAALRRAFRRVPCTLDRRGNGECYWNTSYREGKDTYLAGDAQVTFAMHRYRVRAVLAEHFHGG